jgi:hypothetical protein
MANLMIPLFAGLALIAFSDGGEGDKMGQTLPDG